MIDSDVTPVPAASITTWDHEADVVIAGYGIAGAAAAVEATRSGADVLVLERTGSWGASAPAGTAPRYPVTSDPTVWYSY